MSLKLKVDGKDIPLNEFVEKIMNGTITGAVGSLKGIKEDWKKIEMPFGPPVTIRFSEKKASGLIESAGFTVTDVRDAGRYHYLIKAKQ